MIIKTREELGEAYWNFVGSAKDWQTPRQRGNWSWFGQGLANSKTAG